MSVETESLAALLSDVASNSVSPASGTVLATTGAMGTALCEMVCVHLLQTETADVNDGDLDALQASLTADRDALMRLATEDAAVVEALFGTDAVGDEPTMNERAVTVPLSIAETCVAVLETAAVVADVTDRPVVVDAGIGASLVFAALRGALYLARLNAETLEDAAVQAVTARRVADIETAADRARGHAMDNAGTTAIDGHEETSRRSY